MRLPKRAFCRALLTIVLAILAHTSHAQERLGRFQQAVQPYVDAQMFMGSVLAAVAHGEAPPVPSIHKEIPLPKEILARYAGTYQFQRYSLKMVPEGNHLLVQFDNGSTLPVFPESETRFFSKPWPEQFEFLKDDRGEFTVLARRRNGKDEKGTKK